MRLHATKLKVLRAVSQLSGAEGWVASTQVREEAGISQQLLNRHLHGLAEAGMVELNHPGPGLPLEVAPTGAGLEALEAQTKGGSPGPQSRPPAANPDERPRPMASPGPTASPGSDQAAAPSQAAEPPVRPVAPAEVSELDRAELAPPAGWSSPQVESLWRKLAHRLGGVAPERFDAMVQAILARRGEAEAASAEQEEADEAALGTTWFRRPEPPALNSGQEMIESQLSDSLKQAYRGLPWWRRTLDFSTEWDRMRRRRLGLLSSAFTSFDPRWEHIDWPHFNLARQQADARGADYTDWIRVQWQRVAPQAAADFPPYVLHGQEAQRAYAAQYGGNAEEAKAGPAPYNVDDFSLHDPAHREHAERLLGEIEALARRVYGEDQVGLIKLLARALENQKIPVAALDLRPDIKDQVLATARIHAGSPAGPPHSDRELGLII